MASRGGKPKPTHLKVVTGNPGRRPLPENEPKPRKAMPKAPPHLSGPAREEWDDMATELYECGLLTSIDRGALAAYCQAYGRWVQAEEALARMAERDPIMKSLITKSANGNIYQNPLVGIANKAMADMVRFAAEFGMTPSARTRTRSERAQDDEDPADKYF